MLRAPFSALASLTLRLRLRQHLRGLLERLLNCAAIPQLLSPEGRSNLAALRRPRQVLARAPPALLEHDRPKWGLVGLIPSFFELRAHSLGRLQQSRVVSG